MDNTDGLNPTTLFPEYISADYRLDDMKSITPGIRYGRDVDKDGYLRAKLEYMHQSFKASEFDTNKASSSRLLIASGFKTISKS